jgi:hypothetical protein
MGSNTEGGGMRHSEKPVGMTCSSASKRCFKMMRPAIPEKCHALPL